MKDSVATKTFLTVVFLVCAFCIFAQPGAAADSVKKCLTYDVPASAEISKIAYFMAPYKGKQRLHMEIGLKNTSSELKKFRVHIFLDKGVAGGGLYPRKEDGIEPGKVHTRTFPMYYDEFPPGFEIRVQELD